MIPAEIRRINNDRTQTDQWNPSIAVNPAGTELLIGYYSRQKDAGNSMIMAYGAKGYITNGLANATFECFPISTNSFPPLFAGTTVPSIRSPLVSRKRVPGYKCCCDHCNNLRRMHQFLHV